MSGWPKGWHRPKGKCQVCNKLMALSAPTGDWTLAIYPRRHRSSSGAVCEGTWKETEIEVGECKRVARKENS